jgi:hypothetical protein
MSIYVVVTSAALSPAISFRTSALRSGTIARSDIVAPRDFILPDEESTERKRTEAAAAVLPVYDRDTQAAARIEDLLDRSFRRARELDRNARPEAFLIPIGEEAFRALQRLHFSAEIESRLGSSLNRLYQGGIVDNKELLLQYRDRGISLRELPGGSERRTLDLFTTVEYGSDVKSALAAELMTSRLKGPEVQEVAAFLAAALAPNLTFNSSESARRRVSATRQVESVLTKIPRGQIIVRRGDLINPHVARVIGMVKGSASDPQAWWKLLAVVVLQSLAAFLFWTDARTRLRMMREERSPLLALLSAGILSGVVVRGAFILSQALSVSFPSDAFSSASFAIPFAAGPVLAVLLCTSGPGPAVLLAAVQAAGVGVLMGMNFSFCLFSLAGSLAGIYWMKRLGSRSVLLVLAAVVGGANATAVLITHALTSETASIASDVGAAIFGGTLVAGVVAFFLPLFESLFHVTTDIRLLELSNLNLPLLQTLAFEAPGTYQHSLAVGHLAEAGAAAIGANPLLARVCAYYHDIGKTKMPDYFIENQPRGANRHDKLEPSMSALIIASHVKEGIELARRQRLPEPIVAGIREHHGTKLIRYFFQKALSRVEAGALPVSETDYRYPGPKPSSRVCGILMIADAVEAASRTISEPTPAKISAMVKAIGSDCLRDGQFDECDLTVRDLNSIQEALIRTVTTMHHHRIDYPGFDFNQAEKAPSPPVRKAGETIRFRAR